MESKRSFPAVETIRHNDVFHGRIGYGIESVINGQLLADDDFQAVNKKHPLHPGRFQEQRESLMQALAAWSDGSVFELHYKAWPNILYQTRGRLEISLILTCTGITEDEVKERLVKSHLNLFPLLRSHLPEITFNPIKDLQTLVQIVQPIQEHQAVSVHRNRKSIDLSRLPEPLSVKGFGSGIKNQENVKQPASTEISIEHTFPFVPACDDWSVLLRTLMNQLDPVQIIIRLKPMNLLNQNNDLLDQTIRSCEQIMEAYQDGLPMYHNAKQLRIVALKRLAELARASFQAGVFVIKLGAADTGLARVIGRSVSDTSPVEKEEDFYQGGFACTVIDQGMFLGRDYFYDDQAYSVQEAASVFRFPTPPEEDIPGLPVQRARTCLAFLPETEKTINSLKLFVNSHQGIRQPVFQVLDDRMKHTFILGQTGTGKSSLMESMSLQDSRAGNGQGYFDPHGDSVELMLGKIPKERSDDVIYFDMLDREYPIGLNLLEWQTIEERDMIIDGLYLTLDRLYDMRKVGGPIFEIHFRNMLKLLMGDQHHDDFIPTILEFTLCYQDKNFRSWLKNRTRDQQVVDFVNQVERIEGEGSLKEISTYITSKLNRFFEDITLKRIIGQEKTSLDFEHIMNTGKILLVKMGKGRLGPMASALLANQLVNKFKLAAMKRGEMPVDQRRDFFLYVDEAHNLPVENFMELLSEARKYRMGLVMATQYTAQLISRDPSQDLLSAVLGNVGTLILFRMGQLDAPMLSPILQPRFNSLDLVNLPDWQGYAKLQLGGTNMQPFSFETVKDNTCYDDIIAKENREQSRKKYGRHYLEVDDQIARRRKVFSKK